MKNWHLLAKNIYRRIVPEGVRHIIWRIKRKIFGGIYFFNLETRREFVKYYNSSKMLPADYPKTVIYMADGRAFNGGLADRLRGVVSAYKLCKELNIPFKIHFTSPFVLQDFLLPNVYDWSISPDEICYNRKQARPCFIYTASFTAKQQMFWIKHFFMEKYKQIHVYTNAVIAEKEYGDLFRELFKPVAALESLVQYNLNRIILRNGGGGNTNRKYVAAAFRFLELLGDFREPEGEWHILPDDEKKVLVNKCISHLEAIYRENNCTKVLVTSDSITFLKEAERLPFVYVIPGEIGHIGDTQNLTKDAILKVFLDYFMLTYSQKIYLVVEDRMYQSGFSYRAALHGNVPFIIRRGDSLT